MLILTVASTVAAQSVYTLRPGDAAAVYLERGSYGAVADGRADDTSAVQAAIDRVQKADGQGVVFIAEGRYRLTHTVHLWSGIRLIGYGARRPVFVLGANTPGYQEGHEFLGTGRYMLQFASHRPASGEAVVDANEFTFYSGISNLDFEIGKGNPAAVAIRFHVAQHSFLSHMNFKVGEGRAALEDVGNNASDLHIEGGNYGILSVRTSPAWQFLLMDSTLEGQRKAAIHTQEVGMTLVRDRIAHTPVAVEITHGVSEQLYGRELTLEDISQSALVLGDARKAHHEVTLDRVLCNRVAQVVQGGDGIAGFTPLRAPARHFVEERLTIGLEIGSDGRESRVAMRHTESPAGTSVAFAKDVPALPPMDEWANVRELGAKGDGVADDTMALQRAIDQRRVLYLPIGTYRVTATLRLRRDTVLIGLHPAATLIALWDDEPGFQGVGEVVPVVLSARGGAAIVTGIGIATGEANPRAAGLVWRAGPRSMVEDVNFMAGHGRLHPALYPAAPPPATAAGAGQAHVDTQYPSLWVKDNGGGIFRGIWTASTMAKAGLLVESTVTQGVIYQMSCEHHMRHETQFHHVSNWMVYALQTEEEKPAGAESFSVELENAHHMTFANLFMYRVSRNVMPKLNAVEAADSTDIHFENVHNFSQTRLAFDNSVFDRSSDVRVRSHDFTSFTLTSETKPGRPLPLPAGVFARDAKLEWLATGFSNASSLTSDEMGRVFFTDAALHRIYRWDEDARQAVIVTDKIESPIGIGWVEGTSLLTLDSSRSVFRVDGGSGAVTKVEPVASPRSDARLLLPTGLHNSMGTLVSQLARTGVVYAPRSNMAIVARITGEARGFFYAPGTTAAIMAGGNWQPLLQASQWRLFRVGDEHLAVSEEDDAIYRVHLNDLTGITATEFAPRSGTSVVADLAGNVLVAAGDLFVYDLAGKMLGVVEIPERPSSLVFGGKDKRTLFIGARGSVFAIRMVAPGE